MRIPISRRTFTKRRQLETLESRCLLAAAPLVISEFLASNDNGLADGDGRSSDWIEVHNPTTEPVNLSGWYLADDATQLDKWPFPDVTITADEHLIVFASGQDAVNYVDGAGNLHANFKLDKDGEFLGLSYDDPSAGISIVHQYSPEYPPQFEDVSYGIGTSVESRTLVAAGDVARVMVPTNDSVDAVWIDTDFDDSAWSIGPTGVGYENSAADYASLIQTTVPLGTDSAYLRMNFDVEETAALDSLLLRVQYDDGFVAYLNGEPTPVAQRNAPPSLSFRSVATGNHPDEDAVRFVEFDLTRFLGLLNDGPNVLALHALNQATSSDMLLLPELVATVQSDGTQATGYFADPTPGQANTTGIANPGPVIRNVTENPSNVQAVDDLLITAEVQSLDSPIDTVMLNYRVMYDAEVAIAMSDDGNAGDQMAGDGVYTAAIPGSSASAGQMIRWYVSTQDIGGLDSRAPAFLDATGNGQSAEYFGTVAADSTFSTTLPVFRWFTENESASHSRAGTRASVFYADQFYDNVFVRQRGGATNSSDSQKFDFNSDQQLFVSDQLGSVSEINLNGNGSDPSYLRQSMGFAAHAVAGGSASASFFTAMLLNGSFDRVGVWVEQVDNNFLERQNYDTNGDLYKLVQRSNLNPAVSDITTGVEKKTGDRASLSTFADLVAGVELRTVEQRQAFLRDNIDVAQVINYMAVRSLQHQADDIRKNMYLYQDTQGDGLWRIYPWDLDWTFNIVGGHDNQDSQRTEHPFFGTQAHPTADGANQWNRLYNALFETVEIQQMYLRRLRTLMDQFYRGPTGGTTWFADYVNMNFPDIDPHLGSSVTNGKTSLLRSIEDRRRELYAVYTRNINGYTVVIPDAQTDAAPLTFGVADFSPVSGDMNQQYLELTNPNPFAVDLSGWKLTGGISHQFQPGTVIAPGATLYVTPDANAFRSRSSGPSGGQSLFVQQWNSGPVANLSERIQLLAANDQVVASHTHQERLVGDADLDGAVSFSDFLILSANFGRTEAVFADGDFDEDGLVDFSDFLLLSANFGTNG